MTTNAHHKNLLKGIISLASNSPFISEQGSAYAGHSDKTYDLSNPQLRQIIKDWKKSNIDISLEDFVDLLDSIYSNSESSTEKYMGGYLIEYFPKLRLQINPKKLDMWLNNLTGWAQIDSLCQGKFTIADLESNWNVWETQLRLFNKSDNISKRRASLVLLTGPSRHTDTSKVSKLVFENIENLKHEKDILITKAISWLLRDMTKFYREEVKSYLDANNNSLPKIAIRETRRKLETGRK